MKLRGQENKHYADIMRLIPEGTTVLDLACGSGNPFKGIKPKLLVGVDLFKKKFFMPEYDAVLNYDIRGIGRLFQEKSFDVVTAIDAIEHLRKEEGFKLIESMEKLARQKVVIFTPTVWSENKEAVESPEYWSYGNPYNYHRSLWRPRNFTKLGYLVKPCQEGYVLVEKVLE